MRYEGSCSLSVRFSLLWKNYYDPNSFRRIYPDEHTRNETDVHIFNMIYEIGVVTVSVFLHLPLERVRKRVCVTAYIPIFVKLYTQKILRGSEEVNCAKLSQLFIFLSVGGISSAYDSANCGTVPRCESHSFQCVHYSHNSRGTKSFGYSRYRL